MKPDIFILDDFHPEDNAMLQALYSRSPRSVMDHVEKVREVGSGKFMERYYVGYGHASIGDCGSTTIYLENISILMAKALQDHPLYSGQEASTRYLDFANRPVVDPYNRPESAAIQQQWIALYAKMLPKVQAALARDNPFDPDTYRSEDAWEKAIAARAFDTVRGFLPAGVTTFASWHTNLRQARDQLRRLAHHPLPEVRATATQAYQELLEKYPHSFSADDIAPDSIRNADRNTFLDGDAVPENILLPEAVLTRIGPEGEARVRAGELVADVSVLDVQGLNAMEGKTLAARPAWTPLPRRLLQYGVANLSFLLDFGSFRDLQRHRNGYCPVALVGPRFGFHPWYLNEMKRLLDPADYADVCTTIDHLLHEITALPSHGITTSPELDQYLYPMGMACLCHLTYSLPQMVYVAELRTGQTVHPSLRSVAQSLARLLENLVPELSFQRDMSPDQFSAKRGLQDITERKNQSAA